MLLPHRNDAPPGGEAHFRILPSNPVPKTGHDLGADRFTTGNRAWGVSVLRCAC